MPTHGDWFVMGTTLDVTVYHPASETDAAAADLEAAFSAVAEIDQLMSLYKADSELSVLNEAAGQGPVDISAHTANVLSAANHFAALSDGALDVTVEPLVRLWGFFDVETAEVPSDSDINATLGRTGMDRITVDTQAGTATLKEDTRIDLGSIAKGYGVDRALAVLEERDVPAALVNLGGTVGVLGTHPSGRPWAIGIRHPRENRLMGEIRLATGAVSTSGDYDRFFEVDGKRYSHILDPRSGWPVDGIYAVTVIAPNAMAADALSTAAYVMGRDDGLALLSRCNDMEGLLVEPHYDAEGVSVRKTDTPTDAVSILIDDKPMIQVTRQNEEGAKSNGMACLMPDR